MKVDPNAPAYPSNPSADVYCNLGIPIRLAIAAQIMAGYLASPGLMTNHAPIIAVECLSLADALIAAHNEGSK